MSCSSAIFWLKVADNDSNAKLNDLPRAVTIHCVGPGKLSVLGHGMGADTSASAYVGLESETNTEFE